MIEVWFFTSAAMLSSTYLHIFFFCLRSSATSSYLPTSLRPSDRLWTQTISFSFHLKTKKLYSFFRSLFSPFFSPSWKVDSRLVRSDFDLRSGTRHDLISAYWKSSPAEIHQHLWVRAAGSLVPPSPQQVCQWLWRDKLLWRIAQSTLKWRRCYRGNGGVKSCKWVSICLKV